MEILAIQLKSDVVPNKSAGFMHKSGPEWPAGRTGSSSLKVLRTAIPALRDDQHLIVTPEYSPESARDDLTEFCEVFYNLDRGQWFAWPQRLNQAS
jgi:hypothetical protein